VLPIPVLVVVVVHLFFSTSFGSVAKSREMCNAKCALLAASGCVLDVVRWWGGEAGWCAHPAHQKPWE